MGGVNEFNPNCVNWDQVLGAGKYGSLGAVESMLTLPLGIPYLASYLATGGRTTPRDINAMTLSYIGLDDEYQTALGSPYYVSGQAGGQFAANYISLATLVKGLPTFSSRPITIGSPNIALNGNGTAILSPGVTISIPVPAGGGNLGLVAVGAAGPTSGYLMMSGNGGGGNRYPQDWTSKRTQNKGVTFESEGAARQQARQKIGKNPVEVSPNKLRSQDGKWQYRAKPGDLELGHIHLEELDPNTGEVLTNWHFYWEVGSP